MEPKVLKQLQADSAAYKKLQEAGLSDEEKIQKTLAEAEASKADFQRKSNRLDVEKILVGAGLTEEDYKDLIDGLVSEDAEASKALANSLATMLTKQKEATVQKTKEELMDGTKKPGDNGGSGGNPDDDDEDEDDEDDDYDPKMERITTILAVVAALLVGGIIIFVAGRAFGVSQIRPG